MLDKERILKSILTMGLGMVLCTGCTQQRPSQKPSVADGKAFFVHLQEGFSGDAVRILIDGELIFKGRPTTDPRLGIAEKFSGSAPSTNINLTIEIPGRNIKSAHNIDLTKAKGLGISVQNGKVSIIQADAFGYD